MSFQWDIPHSIDEQEITALDFSNFPEYNPYMEYLTNDQTSQFVNPNSLTTNNMTSTAWDWQEPTYSSNETDLQASQLQLNADQNEPLKEDCLKHVVSELEHRLDKWEEGMELQVSKWEEKAAKQDITELRLSKVEHIVIDFQHEIEAERAKLRIELQAWAEQVKHYVDSALGNGNSK